MGFKVKLSTSVKWLTFAFILFVFGNSWEPGVGLDTATYGAIAKEILRSGSWFAPRLAPGIFDPFVEHPYLILWLDALSIKLLGPTAQAIHFTSSILGIAGLLFFFLAIQKLIDETAAFFSILCLLTVNVFMNFMSSGWLDMPMISFTLIGFYFATRTSEKAVSTNSLLTGFFLGLAVLSKGVAAVGVFPVALFLVLNSSSRLKVLSYFFLGIFTPLAAFTLAHYQSQGFVFWTEYLHRQLFVHNVPTELSGDMAGWLWYPRDILTHAHFVALLFIPGAYFLWKRHYRALTFAVVAQFAIHFLVYAFSYRHNRQYLLPVFPWMALATGFLLSQRWKISVPKWSQGLFYIAVFYFFIVSFIPVTVHNIGSADIYALSEYVKQSRIQKIYFEASEEDRIRGEMTSSYVAWYLDRTPVMFSADQLQEIYTRLTETEALLLVRGKRNDLYFQQADNVCAWNKTWILISTKENCSGLNRKISVPPIKRDLERQEYLSEATKLSSSD